MDPLFRVRAKLYNNRLIAARERKGWATVTAAARATGIGMNPWFLLERLQYSPISSRTGAWRSVAVKIATVLGVAPSELWPEELERVTATETEVAFDLPEDALEPPQTPEELVGQTELKHAVLAAMATLRPREKLALESYFGEDGTTLEATAQRIGLAHGKPGSPSRERTRQMIETAIIKVRHQLEATGHKEKK